MRDSKYWNDMFINDLTNPSGDNNQNIIISMDPPVKYDKERTIVFTNITDNSEVTQFYRKYNRMATGNITLLHEEDLKRFLDLDCTTVLMRSIKKNLIGSVISVPLPIKCNTSSSNSNIIIHGCTTFLCLHPSLRGHGMCMALIRRLTEIGYENKQYCGYHLTMFPIAKNSVSLSSWYRPLNLHRAKELGFTIPLDISSRRAKLRYHTKLPPNHNYVLVPSGDCRNGYEYYINSIKDKKFAFYPDLELWTKWVQSFPTYLIYNEENIVGIVSINTINCIIETTGLEGKILFPIICNGDMESVLPVLNHIGAVQGYDVVYFHQHGNVTNKSLESINALKVAEPIWFSLYNNRMSLDASDIYVPLL